MNVEVEKVDLNNIQSSFNLKKDILGMSISYKDIGQGPVVFCLPSWPVSSIVFLPLAISLKNKFRIIAPDMPGWGGYSSRMLMWPTISNYATIVEEFIKSFKIKEYSIIGYSMGGAIEQILINYRHLKPQKIIFISTLHKGEGVYTKHKKLIDLYRVLKYVPFPDFVVKETLEYIMMHAFKNSSKYYEKYYKSLIFQLALAEAKFGRMKVILSTLLSLFHADLLREYKFPKNFDAMVIYAENDPQFIKEESMEIAKFLNLKPIVLKDADHNHLFFDVNKSSKIIADFLSSNA